MKRIPKKLKWIVGIDEVGRGPLAGPVSVGAFCVPVSLWKKFQRDAKKLGITDSKKLTPAKRDALFAIFKKQKQAGEIQFVVVSASAQKIDHDGISPTIRELVARALSKLPIEPTETQVKLDGSLRAPAHFTNQETIIKGDSKHMAIAGASIVAKVTRDTYMAKQAHKHPEYGFDIHKGYGTRKHQTALRKHGLCALHRHSFCKNY
jgi:ribonuclease HII